MTFHGKSKTLIYFKMSFELLIVYVEMLKMESLAKEENFEDKKFQKIILSDMLVC